jgi:hypothetical protein
MPEQFQGFGITLLYPDSWQASEEVGTESVSLESPEGAFMTITRFSGESDTDTAFEGALAAMREEYEEVEQEETSLRIAGISLAGQVLRFVYLDLIITSQLLIFADNQSSYLVQIQAEDRDYDRLQPVFTAILTSLCQHLNGSAG